MRKVEPGVHERRQRKQKTLALRKTGFDASVHKPQHCSFWVSSFPGHIGFSQWMFREYRCASSAPGIEIFDWSMSFRLCCVPFSRAQHKHKHKRKDIKQFWSLRLRLRPCLRLCLCCDCVARENQALAGAWCDDSRGRVNAIFCVWLRIKISLYAKSWKRCVRRTRKNGTRSRHVPNKK